MSNVRNDLIRGFPQKPSFELISDAGLSWGVYYQNIRATLFFQDLRKLKNVAKFKDYSLFFKLHAKMGLLPSYVVLEQRYFDSKVLPANDEHGGFYDHVPTPVKNVPSPDGLVGPSPSMPYVVYTLSFIGLIIVHGPNGPTPDSEFEHSSVAATVKKQSSDETEISVGSTEML
ncbi:hypothetical protein R1sor_004278 [Riccia sorocarpa]|uniref:Uncharacterized protein n=1 Tax=Riccia sorocarpa TaxID=122646 RepID=A0ABD3H5Y6_9MARC